MAVPADAPEILTLHRACSLPDDEGTSGAPRARELADVTASLAEWTTVVARAGGRLIGSARGRRQDDTWEIDRILVAPDLQDGGLDRILLGHLESLAPEGAGCLAVVTGVRNLRGYRKVGYRPAGRPSAGEVRLVKRRR